MLVRCENCRRSYDFDINDGLCPRCGAYNNLSAADAHRLEAERRARREADLRSVGSLCDAQDARTGTAGRYAPDCMEDSHDPRHAHTGGTYLNTGEKKTDTRQTPKKNPIGIILAIILVLLSLLSNME